MKYLTMSFRNYKGIKNLKIDLSSGGPIYTLVGLNESGKSTILEAINSLDNVPSNSSERQALIPKSEKFGFKDIISMSGELELSEFDTEEIIKYIRTKGYVCDKVDSIIKISRTAKFLDSNEVRYNNTWNFVPLVRLPSGRIFKSLSEFSVKAWQDTVAFIRDNLMPKILYYPNFLFEFPDRIYLSGSLKDSEENMKYYNVVQDVLSYVNPGFSIENHILARLNSEDEQAHEIANALIEKMSVTASDVILDAWRKLFPNSNKSIVLDIKKESKENEVSYYAGFFIKEGTTRYLLSDRSLGFRWFFSFLLFTEFRKMRSTDKSKVIFLLDEPASNLHPSAQTSLLDSFSRLTEKATLIYTTHSHHLINPDWLESAFIVKNLGSPLNADDPPKPTEITIEKYRTFVGQHLNQREYFQPILDALNYKPGLLEKVPGIIIVEGKNDYYTLRTMQKLIKLPYTLSFYPGGGAGSNETIIRLYEAWCRNYLILHDSDQEGKEAVTNYMNSIAGLSGEKLLTFKDIADDLDNKSLEYLFTNSDRLKISKLSSPDISKYSKKHFNAAMQYQLLDQSFEFEDETLNNFELLFDNLNRKLSNQAQEVIGKQ